MPATFALRLFMFALLFFGILPAIPPAQAQKIYTVENVKVDVRAENPVTAREQAFKQAKEQAFGALADKLGTRPEWALQKNFDHLIQNFEITDEKIAPNRYAATYTFRFERRKVQRYLSAVEPPENATTDSDPSNYTEMTQVPPDYSSGPDSFSPNSQARTGKPKFSQLFRAEKQKEASSPDPGQRQSFSAQDPVLLLPYWRENNQTVLWGSGNQWRHTWKRLERAAGSGAEFILPLGDLEDLREIEDTLPRDSGKLARLLARYSAKQIVIAVGNREQQRISADIYIGDKNGLSFWQEMQAPLGPRQNPYGIAAAKILKKIPQMSQNLPQVAGTPNADVSAASSSAMPFNNRRSERQSQEIQVESQFNNVQQWMQIRTLLKRTAGIDTIEILSLKPQSALIYLKLSQPLEQVREGLWQRNLQLEQQADMDQQSPAYQLRIRANGV